LTADHSELLRARTATESARKTFGFVNNIGRKFLNIKMDQDTRLKGLNGGEIDQEPEFSRLAVRIIGGNNWSLLDATHVVALKDTFGALGEWE
jgi:hypothetical protein